MIVAHRNDALHLRRAVVWAALALVPWVALLLSGGDLAQMGGKWGGAALISPVAAYLGVQEFVQILKRDKGIIWINGDRVTSSKFNEKLSDLVSVEQEVRRPRFGIWSERFIVFRFADNRKVSFLGKSIREDVEALSRSISAEGRTAE